MRPRIFFLALLAVATTAGALAQDAGPKLYRWVDKDGKVHFDDALPPEAVSQARDEFSPTTGYKVGSVPRALTDEERAKIAADQAAAAKVAEAAADQARVESVMLASYETEADLIRAYNARINLIKLTLRSTDASVKSLYNNLADLLEVSSEAELDHRKVFPIRVKTINSLHEELVRQQAFQVSHEQELTTLTDEFQRMLARYRVLRAATPIGAAPPAPPTPAATTTP